MSLHAADAFIVVARFVCTGGTASTAKRMPCSANQSGTSVVAKRGRSRRLVIGGNVSGTHRYSVYDTAQRVIACARIDIAKHAEQGWTAVSAPTSLLPSIERGGMHQRNVAKM
ncbi:hypothetical protein [Burkholderia lata]|uniref:hypothetical protein n=1 Tax=Burkholderia lata (strain ATCC 17760 / DSM 23089 / LMG 22485 / NCIMB 9086 / R18194 / 383) TaxID=482957 RepID=UPI0015827A27|nr:hypothetical protein [Burkholderia lata]